MATSIPENISMEGCEHLKQKIISILNIFSRRNGLGDMKYGDGDSYKDRLVIFQHSISGPFLGEKSHNYY